MEQESWHSVMDELIKEIATDLKLHNERLKHIQEDMSKVLKCIYGNSNPKGSLTDRITITETQLETLREDIEKIMESLSTVVDITSTNKTNIDNIKGYIKIITGAISAIGLTLFGWIIKSIVGR